MDNKLINEFSFYGYKPDKGQICLNVCDKIICTDSIGYKVIASLRHLKEGHKPNPISIYNPYSIWNIKNLWLPKYAPNIELVSDKFVDGNKNLLWFDRNKNKQFKASWNNFKKKKGYINNDKNKTFTILKKDIDSYLKINNDNDWIIDDEEIENYKHSSQLLKFTHKLGYKSVISLNNLRSGNRLQYFHINQKEISLYNMILWLKLNTDYSLKAGQQYTGTNNTYILICNKHGEFSAKFDNIQKGCKCLKCYQEDNKGENHPSWKGGITSLQNYLRACTRSWKKDSLNKYLNKCIITGKKSKTIHHLYGFDLIISEVLKTLKYPIKLEVKDYTKIELKNIKKLCLELHYKYGLGVCITNKIHKEFHSIYGYGNNTANQFIEFLKTQYKMEVII